MRKVSLGALMAVGLLAACSTSTSAPPVASSGRPTIGPPPRLTATRLSCPKDGTIIKTSLGNTLAFFGSGGPICNGEVDGVPANSILSLWSASAPSAGEATRALQALDLTSARRVRFQQNGTTSCPGCTWVNTFSVDRTEQIEVGAGVFDTYLIRWNQTNQRGYEQNVWIWYAPEIGYAVKKRVDVLRGIAGNQRSWEAVEVITTQSRGKQ